MLLFVVVLNLDNLSILLSKQLNSFFFELIIVMKSLFEVGQLLAELIPLLFDDLKDTVWMLLAHFMLDHLIFVLVSFL